MKAQQSQASTIHAATPPPRNKDAKSPKLPSFIDEKDELDSYLLRFERYAENASWEKDIWAIKLSALLTGRAMDVYTRMSDADTSDYDKLKKALLTRYNYTEDGYRKRFREATPETEETPDQFVIRLKKYLIAHREQLGKSKATVQPRRADQKKTTQSKPDSSQGRQRSLQCYRCHGFGHRQSECGTKTSPGKEQKGSSTPVSQSSQKNTRAMVAQLDEDGEKAFTCVEVEGTRSRSNLKKSGTEGSTNSDRTVYSAVCRAQSNDGQTYVGVGKLNGRPVKVLRDTGCTGMIVDRALVPEVMVIPGSSGSLQMVDHMLIDVPLANIYLDSPYYKGHCRVMCVSSPVYPNYWECARCTMNVARPRLEAWTSGGNKEGATEDKCVAGPVVMRAQAKKSDKVHLLKV